MTALGAALPNAEKKRAAPRTKARGTTLRRTISSGSTKLPPRPQSPKLILDAKLAPLRSQDRTDGVHSRDTNTQLSAK